jgi:adenine-specific DNA-methyltransferase
MRYIGSKTNLLPQIREVVGQVAKDSTSICDIFAGTGAVGREFKSSHHVISNDILFFCYALNRAYVETNQTPKFLKVTKELGRSPIEFFNSLPLKDNAPSSDSFIAQQFSPAGQDGRMYLTVSNALLVDEIRTSIEVWLRDGLINEEEYFYLLASLIEAVPSVSNIAGTYGAYLKHWDSRTAKRLILSEIETGTSLGTNQVHNRDANELIETISGDVLYMDPPYNGRQYSSNYHVLETIARYDNPELKGKTGTRVDSSGVSDYCKKPRVAATFEDLVEKANFKTLVISYSSEGLLSEDELVDMLKRHGNAKSLNFKKIPYRRYKRLANDERPDVTEYLIAINK